MQSVLINNNARPSLERSQWLGPQKPLSNSRVNRRLHQ
jgi:hypothetical protein